MPDTLHIDRDQPGGSAADRPLVLQVLGEVSATHRGRTIPFSTRKAKALLAYLALSDGHHDTRERLVGLLWSESDEEHARASLRQAVHEIKTACDGVGFDGLEIGKQSLALLPGRFTCDVDEIVAAAARREVHPRLLTTLRLPDALLENLDNLDPAFHVWIRTKRQLLYDRLTSSLEALLPPEDADADASEVATALLGLDPTHEPACRHLIRIRERKGDVGGALKAYKGLWDVLDSDFDIEPSQKTQDLIVGLRQRGASGADPAFSEPGEPAPTAPEPPSPPRLRALLISVLAFDASGVPPDRRYVVTGFQHELLAYLARLRDWSVRALSPQQAPEPLSWSSPPEYLVEGTAYEAGGAIRLILTFRDAATSICIWSERFTLNLTTWFDTQQHIVRQVATAVNVHLSAERLRRLSVDGGVAIDVHDRWLRGRSLVHYLDSADWVAAAEVFENLVRDAPDFVPALTSLVQLHNTEHIAHPGRFRNRAKYGETVQKARRAARLDPLDPRAQLNLAWTHQLDGRIYESTVYAALAADLNGNDPWTLMSAGQIFAYCGDHPRAEDLATASIDLTPMVTPQQMTYLSAIKFLIGDYAACVEAAGHGLEASPGFRIWSCAALAYLDRRSEAEQELALAFGEIAGDWHGPAAPDPTSMSHWLLHIFPIVIADDWERLRTGLAKAGAPVSSLAFGVW